MKKVLAWLLIVALTIGISIGATLAYLTDTDEDVNVMTLGNVKIDQLEYERIDDETKNEDAKVQEFHDNKPMLPAVTDKNFDYTPGDTVVQWDQIGKDGYSSKIWNPEHINNELDKMVFIKNKGKSDAYVRSIFAFEAGNYTTVADFKNMVHLNLNETDFTWKWTATPVTIGESTYFIATATYNKVLEPGALTEISLSQIALDSSATNADVEAFGETYQILVKSQAIQTAGFDDPAVALDEGFGPIDESSAPWDSDIATKGIDLRKALHYYEGGTTKITDKITNIVFAKTDEYPEIADAYDATLVDVDQDVPVYTYYVPNGSYYDVYFLASDDIYLPVDSSAMFSRMSELVTVDTHNMNTSRVVDLTDAFYRCAKLTTIDPTGWDVSNVKTLLGTFCRCTSLTSIDVTGWDTSSVTDMSDVFSSSTGLVTIKGLETWDTSNATTMASLFSVCTSLTDLSGISQWDTSKVTTLYQTFKRCESLPELDVNNWDTSNVTDMHFTFRGARSLTELDLSGWDTGKVTTFSSMFSSENSNTPDMQLKTVNLANWDTGSCTAFSWMFYGCAQLEEVDVSNWNCTSLTTVYHMFADCNKLTSVNLSGWETPVLNDMDGMFNDCHALVSVDLSDLDTQNVEDMSQLFESCYSLKEVKGMENWDTSKVWDFDQMFLNCSSIEVIDLSPLDTSAATQTSTMFQSCTSLKTIYVGDGWDLSNVTDSGNMFKNCRSLVGANGTTFDASKTDIAYAHVDVEGNPGYLTYKAPAAI